MQSSAGDQAASPRSAAPLPARPSARGSAHLRAGRRALQGALSAALSQADAEQRCCLTMPHDVHQSALQPYRLNCMPVANSAMVTAPSTAPRSGSRRPAARACRRARPAAGGVKSARARLSHSWTRLGKRPQGTVYEKGRSSQPTSRKRPSGEGANELYRRGGPRRRTSPLPTCAAACLLTALYGAAYPQGAASPGAAPRRCPPARAARLGRTLYGQPTFCLSGPGRPTPAGWQAARAPRPRAAPGAGPLAGATEDCQQGARQRPGPRYPILGPHLLGPSMVTQRWACTSVARTETSTSCEVM